MYNYRREIAVFLCPRIAAEMPPFVVPGQPVWWVLGREKRSKKRFSRGNRHNMVRRKELRVATPPVSARFPLVFRAVSTGFPRGFRAEFPRSQARR